MNLDQHVEVAIRCALEMNPPDEYRVWAERWLSGEDRTEGSAKRAWSVAWDYWASARTAAANATGRVCLDSLDAAMQMSLVSVRVTSPAGEVVRLARDHGIDVDAIIAQVEGKA